MTFKRIICLDFDGVVHSYTSGWKGPRVIPDPPMPGALQFMHRLLNDGFDVHIHSSRSGYWLGRMAMRTWLYNHAVAKGLWYELGPGDTGLEDVKFPLYKPPAHVSIDDRALRFVGNWPSHDELKGFRPWKP